MAEPAGAKVNSDPEFAVFVLKQIDVVVSRPDGAKLRGGQLIKGALRLELGVGYLLEDGMIDRIWVRPPDTETDLGHDFIHDTGDVDFGSLQVGADGFVSAADVVANSAW